MPLDPGLYLVATPIGNAEDITLRALRVLREADMLAAEDTRQTRKLMEMHGVPLSGRRVRAYHDRNGPEARPRLLAALAEGQSVAYASDAGTPLVADPGFRLAQAAIAAGHRVHPVPGASAPLAALTLAGLPTDRFLFAGFPPAKAAARRGFLQGLAAIDATLVLFESPRRLAASLADMAAVLDAARPAAICRELTKRFEEARRDSLGALATALATEPAPKGEVVVVIGPPEAVAPAPEDVDSRLRAVLAEHSVRDAAALVAAETGVPRREVYARALSLKRD